MIRPHTRHCFGQGNKKSSAWNQRAVLKQIPKIAETLRLKNIDIEKDFDRNSDTSSRLYVRRNKTRTSPPILKFY